MLIVRGLNFFEGWNLPQNQANAFVMQCVYHTFGVGPFACGRESEIGIFQGLVGGGSLIFGVVPNIKGGFVAPCLNHQDRGVNSMQFGLGDLVHNPFL